MAQVVGELVGAKSFYSDFFASAALAAGIPVLADISASTVGEAKTSTTTSFADALGVTTDAVTVSGSAVPATEPIPNVSFNQQDLVRVIANPFQIVRFRISGTATDGAALATAAPAQILTNTVADSSSPYATITALVGTVTHAGGLVKGRTGSNVGAIRKLNAHTNSVSTVASLSFMNPILVGDTFIRVPFSRNVNGMTLTTLLKEARGDIAAEVADGTAAARVVNVIIDEVNDQAFVDICFSDHWFNTVAL